MSVTRLKCTPKQQFKEGFAHEAGNAEVEQLLSDILSEERRNDLEFTEKAVTGINQSASDGKSQSDPFAKSKN